MPNEKNALVTGANKGIGLEISRQLAEKGFHVFLTARKPDAGLKAAAKLQKQGKATFIELDVTEPDSVKRAARELAAAVDHLDVLINNAAILEDDGGVLD